DEAFPMFHEETDWCIRIWRAGWEVWFLPTSDIVHLGGTSTSLRWGESVVLEYYKAKQQFIRKHYGRGELIAHRAFISALFLLRLVRARFTGAFLRLRGDGPGAAEQRRRAELCRKALALELVLRVPAPDTREG